MQTATLTLKSTAAVSKPDARDWTRETFRAAYGMARRMIRDRATHGTGAAWTWYLRAARRRFTTPAGWRIAQLAGRVVFDASAPSSTHRAGNVDGPRAPGPRAPHPPPAARQPARRRALPLRQVRSRSAPRPHLGVAATRSPARPTGACGSTGRSGAARSPARWRRTGPRWTGALRPDRHGRARPARGRGPRHRLNPRERAGRGTPRTRPAPTPAEVSGQACRPAPTNEGTRRWLLPPNPGLARFPADPPHAARRRHEVAPAPWSRTRRLAEEPTHVVWVGRGRPRLSADDEAADPDYRRGRCRGGSRPQTTASSKPGPHRARASR